MPHRQPRAGVSVAAARPRQGRGLPALIRALTRRSAYPHAVARVRVLQTHISWVLLTGEFAYKVKKPVDLGFLDFSTLELRRAACLEELRLNRRLAADLYLGVVPVTGTPQAPRVGGEAAGPVLEYAVRMREFPQDEQLDRRLAARRLEAGELEAFARDLATFHDWALRAGAADRYGEPAVVRAPAFDSLAAVMARARGPAEAEAAHGLHRWLEGRDDDALLRQRKAGGFIREGHGDLHLANLVRWRGRVLPFDCIEFDPALRWIDVMSDIAFLAMDLRYRGADALAYAFLNAYLEPSGDYEGVRVLRYYEVYRAIVRAKIAAIRRETAGPGRADTASVRGHLALARRLAAPGRAALVLMHGLSGSGKTWLSGALATALPAIRLRSDVERKRLHGLAAAARSRSAPGAGLYDAGATQATYARLATLAEAVIAGGETAIVDAAFLRRAHRDAFVALAQRLRVPCVIVSCAAPREVLEQRLRARGESDASEADASILPLQLRDADALAPDEGARVLAVDSTAGAEPGAVARELKRRLAGSEDGGAAPGP